MLTRKTLGKRLDKRAISNVVSAVILTGAAIALGLATLAWSQGMASDYVREYGEMIDVDIARLKERLAVEYIFYNNTNREIKIYILNCGTIDDVKIQSVHIKTSTWNHVFSNPSLKFLNGSDAQELDIGGEGYVLLSLPSTLTTGVYYYVRIVTVRGAMFDSCLVA